MEIENLKGKKLFKAVMKDVKPIRGGLLWGASLMLLSVIAGVFGPMLAGRIVDLFDDFVTTGLFDSRAFTILMLTLSGVFIFHAVFQGAKTVILNNVVSRHFTCKLRISMSDKIKRLPVSYIDTTKKGELIERMTEDVSTIGMTVHQFVDLAIMGVLQLILIIIMMFLQDWRLAILVTATIPLSAFASVALSKKMHKHFDVYMSEAGKLYGTIEESYGGVKTMRTYGFSGAQRRKYAETNTKLADAGYNGARLAELMQPLVAIINKLGYVAICFLGGYLAVRGLVTFGGVFAIVMYASQLSGPMESMAHSMSHLQRVGAASRRVYGMLALDEMTEGDIAVDLSGETVRLENVDFAYEPEKPVLEGLSLNISKGQKIAIVGPTGGGKTTVVNLLMRFYDPSSGVISVDGHNTVQLPRENVRSAFAMVLQDTWLFSGTIADNVSYGKPNCPREQIIEACKLAYCHSFIEALPESYDYIISEDAQNISQGQKQLLTIARAYLSDRPMLILDEATSNVDTRTEALLQKAMDKLMENRTCFVIAHRLSTIINADNILVINDGKIIEQGNHSALIQKSGFYYEMFNSQYNIG